MRKIMLATLVIAIGIVLTACDGGATELNDETYAEIWIGTYETWDGADEGAWDEALKEYGTSAEEYNAFTVELLEGDDARYTEVTKAIEDDFAASMSYFGYTMSVGLGGFGEELGDALDEGLGELGDVFGEMGEAMEESLETAGEAMEEAAEATEEALEEVTEETAE